MGTDRLDAVTLLVYVEAALVNRWHRAKGFLLKLYLLMHGCKVGRRLKCKSWPTFRNRPKRNLFIGDNVTIGYRITFQPLDEGRIILSDRVNLTQDIIIVAGAEVSIGRHTGIAEFVSIRDCDHVFEKGKEFGPYPLVCDPVYLGDCVQISAGCSIFRGARIESGALIGPHSVVTRGMKIVKNGVYLGNPPKLIGKRF